MALPTVEEFERFWERRIEGTSEALRILSSLGWFPSMQWPIGFPGDHIEEIRQDPSIVHDDLCDFFRRAVDDVDARSQIVYPDRASVIADAFGAHREGKFNLSVPVLLAQSDGIARAVANYKLFENEKRPEKVATILGAVNGLESKEYLDFFDAILEPLKTHLPVATGMRKEDQPGTILRRHSVMHGIDSSYGTEVVALQAVSLFSFIALDLPQYVELGTNRRLRHEQAV